jgi:glycosyltransferase involved in cell wall biosynthesis
MRVLIDTSPLENANQGRGVGAYTRELVAALRELPKADSPLIIQTTSELGSSILDPAAHFDLVHFPFFDLFFPTLKVPKGVPTIVTIHDTIPLIFPAHYPVGVRGRWHHAQQRWQLHKVAAVLTDSQCSARDITRHLHVPAHKVHVTLLAPPTQLQPISEYLAHKQAEMLKLPDKYAVYVGDINYNKNLPNLLLALTQMPADFHLCVVSQAFTNTAIPEGKELAKIMAENGLRDRVHVITVPTGDWEAMAAVLQRSRCLIQPSRYEGFGLPVLEAMKVGAIVVSSNAGSLPEVAGAAAISVKPNLAGLVEGLQTALHLRGEEREDRVRLGQAWAMQFTWTKTAQTTYDVYQSIVKRHQAQQGQV